MKALVFNIMLNSLYSIRMPFTWQSALTYPVLPPSAVIGLLANALQRYKNDKHPLEYLNLIENKTFWAGSKLLTPCIIKSYTTSAIVKWGDTFPVKFTNALCRQFAYSQQLQIVIIFKDESAVDELVEAIKTVPITCGDSESSATVCVDSIKVKDVYEIKAEKIATEFLIPFDKDIEIIEGSGRLYLMHERCKKVGNELPLKAYIVPVREENGILYPSTIEVKINNQKVFKIENWFLVVKEKGQKGNKIKKRRG